ncbi:hypothetical protein D9615_000556 [Tricholomella constricta]|uniref:AAA+ ATPase domain-containing protein n=1 Tax=Tricholomella constricta TaxID=117010 RepID=A0A8H5MBF2_9AGAR|nr:hypothetical protein D9615_000556 [Tricholomella constricta]
MDSDDAFVNVWFDKEDGRTGHECKKDFYGKWSEQASAKHSSPLLAGADALRRLYPNHSVVLTTDYKLNILNHPGVLATPVEKTPLVTNTIFLPIARGMGAIPGLLVELVEFGAFKISWDKYEYLLFVVQFPSGFGMTIARYVVHHGPEDPSHLLLIAVGAWSVQLHDEIWVFNEGWWQKDHGLWVEIQKADWKDVILKDTFKKALQKDVYGFFASEEIYKDLGIPWKRGLIMYGPPGNGKTISIKVIMKTCEEQGFTPLYVKSFQSYMGEERSMADVFNHARQMSPCVVILEDLDSLINDRNRSFFLNQLDGLTGNDGLLVIGTTNHFDRLDPGLSSRPSRFDRKFKFDDPDREERVLYAKYWQNKLKDNKNISFPDQLLEDIADATEQFSFAYLKEAFVSSLVELASQEGDDKPTFEALIKAQIKTLKKELDRGVLPAPVSSSMKSMTTSAAPKRPARPTNERDVHSLLDSLSESIRLKGRRYVEPIVDNQQDTRLFMDTVLSDRQIRDSSAEPSTTRGPYSDYIAPPSGLGEGRYSSVKREMDVDMAERMHQLRMRDLRSGHKW